MVGKILSTRMLVEVEKVEHNTTQGKRIIDVSNYFWQVAHFSKFYLCSYSRLELIFL